MRLYATHRLVTGVAYSIGYVMNNNRVVESCGHRHRFGHRAQKCAERMLRRHGAAGTHEGERTTCEPESGQAAQNSRAASPEEIAAMVRSASAIRVSEPVVPANVRCYCRNYHCAGDCGPEDA